MPPLPGVTFRSGRRGDAPAPTRTDVAGFVGRTRRGPRVDRARAAAGEPGYVAAPPRVEEWVGFAARFGGLDPDAPLTYAVRGYFECGGTVAHVARVAGESARPATAYWDVASAAAGALRLFADAGFEYSAFTVSAADPGDWATGGRVRIEYVRDTPAARETRDESEPPRRGYAVPGAGKRAAVNITVEIDGEPTEYLAGLDPARVVEQVAERSALIRLEPTGERAVGDKASAGSAVPRRMLWSLTLADGDDGDFPPEAYAAALDALLLVPDVALVVLPDAYEHLPAEELPELLRSRLPDLVACQDRMLLLDPPRTEAQAGAFATEQPAPGEESAPAGATALLTFADAVRTIAGPGAAQRVIATYHPWVRVADPFGPPARPLRAVPPAGHVAGVIARLDRERGAGVTPANAPLYDALDLDAPLGPADAGRVYAGGINLLLAQPGRGLVVWGGRTIDTTAEDRYLAHRRFMHRLVRTLRALVEPLVHDVNGPDLRKLLERGVAAVLAAAFRGGLLKGATPEEAYRVSAADALNPPEQRADGVVRCEVEVALAVPLEFIALVVTMSERGQIEVFEP